MKKILLFFLFIFFLLAGCSNDKGKLSRLPSDAVILSFGNSLTRGYGVRENESYPAVLQNLIGRKVINAGIAGEESASGLQRLPSVLEKYHPDFLILCHGGNDILRKRNMTQLESNIRKMIKIAKKKNIPVILLGVPGPGLFLSSHAVYEKIAESTDIIFIKNILSEVLRDRKLKSDSIHPNKEGYRVIAEEIYSVLKKNGAISSP